MKSILIEKPNQLAIVEREIPTPSAGEVRVKVKLAGICGSDSHIYRGHNPFAKYPRVIGHEFFGVIDAVGEGVESARVGERVAVDPVVIRLGRSPVQRCVNHISEPDTEIPPGFRG
ncbi:alcohol dehydrogenase catalytic domain-containing protein [Escherichia coli]|nr:alcohol dehydrogenase catalytic domain-containing protein [Escherichia coli]